MEVDVLSRKGKARANLARGRKVARKAKRIILERVTEIRKLNTRDSMVSAETVENTATKRRIAGTNNNISLSWQRQRHGQVEIQRHRDQRKRHKQTS